MACALGPRRISWACLFVWSALLLLCGPSACGTKDGKQTEAPSLPGDQSVLIPQPSAQPAPRPAPTGASGSGTLTPPPPTGMDPGSPPAPTGAPTGPVSTPDPPDASRTPDPTDAGGTAVSDASPGASSIAEVIEIADVWAGHPVHFDLVTQGEQQFVAFYDSERRLTVGQRTLGAPAFALTRLPSVLGWDSHNDVVLAIDRNGHVHVAGNMHSTPLVYFRTTRALDVASLEQLPSMVGRDESACTYPQFFHAPSGQLVFMYRSGGSGNGNHIFNAYDPEDRVWNRLHGSALTDGQGQRNAYPVGPIQGPDGLFHLVWVWRDTPDASTNHDLSYARSSDLVNWQSAAQRPIPLPITLSTGDVVDPVRSGAGMINNNTKVGFDAQGRVIVSYHKYDAQGFTQLYNARFEAGRWVVHRTSSWRSRWDFGGGGTLVFAVEVFPVEPQPDGTLVQSYFNANEGGNGAFRLNPDDLAALETISSPSRYPPELARVESPVRDMEVRWQPDRIESDGDGMNYMLRWETLPSNRDQPRATIPPATPLRLYGFRSER